MPVNKSQYYLRISKSDETLFDSHLTRNNISASELSRENGTILFSLRMTNEEAMSVRLAFQTAGFLNFSRALGKTIKPLAIKPVQC